MAMTIQQAQMKAMQLRAQRPELQNMAVGDLVAQIMMAEGMGAPGAGGGGLADIFQPARVITPSSPAPMEAARLAAPKPTADIVPGAGVDAFRRAQQVRDFTVQPPSVDERSAANARVQQLIAELPASGGERAPEVVAAMPVAAPEVAPEAAPEAAPKPQFQSRYRPQLEQAQAELEQLKATVPAGTATPPELASRLRNLSGVVSRLQGIVAAEEGAVVDADRAALLERQAERLSRDEKLIEQSRRLAPGTALMEFGAALAGAKPGERFASALARGLRAGSESYRSARNESEASLRGIEEKRDAYTLQKIDAIDKARAKAIEMANAGVELTKEGYALASLEDADVIAMGTQQAKIDEAVARADKAKTEAQYAEKVIQSGLEVDQAQISNYRETRGSGRSDGSGGDENLSPTQAFNRAESSRKKLDKLEKRIIDADGKGDVATVEQLLNQYKSDRDAYNENAPKAKLAPITVRGFPVKLPKYEAYVKKNKGRHPSGITAERYGAYAAANKYAPK
jgi:hypothetical protein